MEMEYKKKVHKLKTGEEVIIRMLTPDDYEKSLTFFTSLSEKDRMYLRVDVTDPEVVKRRMGSSKFEHSFRIVALKGDKIVGDGVLCWPKFGWMSHVGELRAIVDKDYRRAGLASVLFRELFVQGVKYGLEKLEAWMRPEQEAAKKCLEHIGFVEEGMLPGFAMDATGKINDLIVTSCNI